MLQGLVQPPNLPVDCHLIGSTGAQDMLIFVWLTRVFSFILSEPKLICLVKGNIIGDYCIMFASISKFSNINPSGLILQLQNFFSTSKVIMAEISLQSQDQDIYNLEWLGTIANLAKCQQDDLKKTFYIEG